MSDKGQIYCTKCIINMQQSRSRLTANKSTNFILSVEGLRKDAVLVASLGMLANNQRMHDEYMNRHLLFYVTHFTTKEIKTILTKFSCLNSY